MKTSMIYGIALSEKREVWAKFAHYFERTHEKTLRDAVRDPEALRKGMPIEEQRQMAINEPERVNLSLAVDVPTGKRILLADNVKQYYITESVARICALNTFPTGIDYRWLALMSDGIRQYNYADHLFRWEKQDNQFVVFYCRQFKPGENPTDPTRTDYQIFFRIDMDQKVSYVYGDPVSQAAQLLFYQFICYIELNEIQVIVVPGKTKHGSKKDKDNLLNETQNDVIIVDRRWNTTIKVMKDITVTEHWRNQPIGPRGSGLTKPVFIQEFHKSGYTVKARKENDEK